MWDKLAEVVSMLDTIRSTVGMVNDTLSPELRIKLKSLGAKMLKSGNYSNKVVVTGKRSISELKERSGATRVALIVEVSQPAMSNAEKALKHRDDIDLVALLTTATDSKKPKNLDNYKPEEWESLIQDFSDIVSTLRADCGPIELHVFLACPAALAFGLGSEWKLLAKASVYQLVKGGEYVEVINTQRFMR